MASPDRKSKRLTRLAWLVSIATPVLLLALLGAAKAASGPATSVPVPVSSVEPVLEEECFEPEDGEFECEFEEEGDVAEESALPPEECVLQTARARVVSQPRRNQLRFVVHYRTVEPTRAYLDFQLRGHGSLDLGIVKRHLGRSGVVRLQETLGDGEMQRALQADGFLFTLDIPAAPSACRPYFTQRLSVKRIGHGQTAWFEARPSSGG